MKRFAREVLLEMKWSGYGIHDITISYVSRGSPGDIALIGGMEISKIDRSFLILSDGTHIPFHRLRKIENDKEILWIRKGGLP
jgi:uncharacterized protein (UPF0248 family)